MTWNGLRQRGSLRVTASFHTFTFTKCEQFWTRLVDETRRNLNKTFCVVKNCPHFTENTQNFGAAILRRLSHSVLLNRTAAPVIGIHNARYPSYCATHAQSSGITNCFLFHSRTLKYDSVKDQRTHNFFPYARMSHSDPCH